MRFVPLFVAWCVCASFAAAQPAGSDDREPHHHMVYEDKRVRILDLQIEPRGSTLLHRHETDYVGMAQAGTGMHFSHALAHVERNDAGVPLREIVVDLLQRQTNPRNVCGEVLRGEYLHCREPGPEWLGANLQVQFETDQTHFGIVRIAPEAALSIPPAEVPPLLIPLEGAEAEVVSRVNGAPAGSSTRRGLRAVEVFRSPADHVSEIRNVGKTAARFLVVEFGGAGE